MKNNSKPSKKGVLFKIVILLFIIFSLVNLTAKQIELSKKQAQLDELKAQEAALVQSNKQLQALIDSGSYDELIERALRENGYVYADERAYNDIQK